MSNNQKINTVSQNMTVEKYKTLASLLGTDDNHNLIEPSISTNNDRDDHYLSSNIVDVGVKLQAIASVLNCAPSDIESWFDYNNSDHEVANFNFLLNNQSFRVGTYKILSQQVVKIVKIDFNNFISINSKGERFTSSVQAFSNPTWKNVFDSVDRTLI